MLYGILRRLSPPRISEHFLIRSTSDQPGSDWYIFRPEPEEEQPSYFVAELLPVLTTYNRFTAFNSNFITESRKGKEMTTECRLTIRIPLKQHKHHEIVIFSLQSSTSML